MGAQSSQPTYFQRNQFSIWFLVSAGAIVLLWWVYLCTIDLLVPATDPSNVGLETRGVWGDKFGGLNALFAGLAFAGIIVTIIMQAHELKEQRRELQATTKALEEQKEQMQLQNFENT